MAGRIAIVLHGVVVAVVRLILVGVVAVDGRHVLTLLDVAVPAEVLIVFPAEGVVAVMAEAMATLGLLDATVTLGLLSATTTFLLLEAAATFGLLEAATAVLELLEVTRTTKTPLLDGLLLLVVQMVTVVVAVVMVLSVVVRLGGLDVLGLGLGDGRGEGQGCEERDAEDSGACDHVDLDF